MVKALFAYQYGMANAGDFAINIGSLDLLAKHYDDVTILSKLTSNDIEYEKNIKYLNKYYPNFKVVEGPFNLNRGSALNTLKSYVLGTVKYPILLNTGKYSNATKNSDILFLNGGNILRCTNLTDYVRLQALLFPLRLARKQNMKYVLLPHSTTFINKKGIRLLEPFLNKANVIFAREEISYKQLTTNFPKSNIVKSLDSAFFITNRIIAEREYEQKYEFLADKKNNICITLRKEELGDIGELSDETKKKIRITVIKLINRLLEDKYSVTFVIQTKKDKEFTNEIYRQFETNPDVVSIEEYDPLILREIYRNSLCLFGMRLHSMILAMSVGTPVVGYFEPNWGSKNPGTLGQFDMPYGYIDECDDLFSLFEISMSNKENMNKKISISKNQVLMDFKKNI